MSKLWLKLKFYFVKHEFWVLNWAAQIPLLALFVAATLWIWLFLPAIILTLSLVIISIMFDNSSVFEQFAIATSPLNIALLLLITLWFFRWYFICVALMFGKTKLAANKRADLLQRFEKLKNQCA